MITRIVNGVDYRQFQTHHTMECHRAQQFDETTRTAFANDPLNLLAVDGPTNGQKGDGDAATWLPASHSFRCDYIARQIAVKARYNLWVTAAERGAMARVLTDCPDQVLPTDQAAATAYQVDTTATQSPTPEPVPRPPASAPQAPAQGGTDPQFTSCVKAKAAATAPTSPGWIRNTTGMATATTTASTASEFS